MVGSRVGGGHGLAILGYVLDPRTIQRVTSRKGSSSSNPTGVEGFGSVAGAIIAIGTIVALSLHSPRRSRSGSATGERRGQLRQQMRLLVFVAGIAGVTLVVSFTVSLVSSFFTQGTEIPIFYAFFLLLVLTLLLGTPGAYLIAIFRHGLWDMDLVIRKTVQYGVLVVAFMVLGFFIVAVDADGADRCRVRGQTTYRPSSSQRSWRRCSCGSDHASRGSPTDWSTASERRRTRCSRSSANGSARPTPPTTCCRGWHSCSCRPRERRRADVWLRVGTELRAEATWPTDASAPHRPDDSRATG